jgi:hypothetical protein
VYNLAEGLVKPKVDVTLFATGDAKTTAKLDFVIDTPLELQSSQLHSESNNKHITYCLSKAGGLPG